MKQVYGALYDAFANTAGFEIDLLHNQMYWGTSAPFMAYGWPYTGVKITTDGNGVVTATGPCMGMPVAQGGKLTIVFDPSAGDHGSASCEVLTKQGAKVYSCPLEPCYNSRIIV